VWRGSVWVVVALCGVSGAATKRVAVSPWDAAVAARAAFEAEPPGTHTKLGYTKVMDDFRAIYHGSPGAAHAPKAVEQVAELLAEQGRELGDVKSLRDAAGQYEFLAKAYPGGAMAAGALGKALALLGPDAANDPAEAKKVKRQLETVYPKYAKSVEKSVTMEDVVAVAPTSQKREVPPQRAIALAGDPGVGHPILSPVPAVSPTRDDKAVTNGPPGVVGPPAVVSGIRHWSTASYTRVAIDLNVEGDADVKYEAARVENPDRIFFDLHHAKLAPGLVGKSFAVTDDGFLTKMRAAQYSDDVTRVVLDVHEVAEYSAFLLPNPERLIIDIHGKPGGVNSDRGGVSSEQLTVNSEAVPAVPSGGAVSSLPPMPVTDGSAGFGLPSRTTVTKTVPQPRVVVSTKPTEAKPVPNTVTKSSSDTGTEVAAVSEQPGMLVATRKPTSQPVVSKSSEQVGQHYQPKSRRSVAADSVVATTPTSQRRDVGHPSVSPHVEGEPAEPPPPTADGETSLVRALGLKIGRIVIDAGHGGHDSGTLGAGGIEEKDVVLDVALRLGKLLHDRLGAEIVYTRADDTFIPLETRTAIANKAQADLFISVHANSSSDETARGVEVYYLNFTSDPDAMRVAARENAVSTQSVHDLSDLVKKIALKDKIDESKELASDVDQSLYAGLRKGNVGLKDRGVKKAPFVVLIGANMPSILAEISFVTNPSDAAQLQTPEYRERVAESLYGGVAKYASGINGEKPRVRTVERAAVK
jgi:N-acetylmuramoyl-L-alanine amidase